MTDEVFDAIVVGGGIAGAVCAHRLAAAGRQVALLERGEVPGEKNLSGGVLYSRVLEQEFPGFLENAPVERRVTRHVLGFLNPSSHVALDYGDARLGASGNAVTVLRARLDPWLVEQAEAAGALVMPGVLVDALVVEAGQVVGVRAGDDELRARVVVAADGVNSFLACRAGFRSPQPSHRLALGVKSVVRLPRGVLEDRFRLRGDEGVAYAYVGDATCGIAGGGFLYTNTDSVSVGVVLRLDDLVRSGRASADVHDHLLGHPAVAPLLAGGELLEYGAHLTIEDGPGAASGTVARPGFLVIGDAAGLTLNTGLTVRGMDLAAMSAVLAADVVDTALAAGDVGQAAMDAYPAALARSAVGRDLATFGRTPRLLRNPRLYGDHGALLADVLHGVFDHDGTPHRSLARVARDAVARSGLRWGSLVKDAVAAWRSL